MSRIQTILDKAEREGTARRFRADVVPAPAPESTPRDTTATPMPPPEPLGTAVPPRLAPLPRTPVPLTPAATVTAGAADLDGRGRTSEPADDAAAWQRPDGPLPDDAATAGGQPAPAGRRSLSPSLVAALHPNALAAEQFRTLRTRIANSTNGRGARTLLLTSPGHREGKSVMAANLALTMAQEIQQRVCLVDASLRDASIHTLFGLPDVPGLVDVLVGDATLDEALVYLEDYSLTVLPAGRLPRHPAELLGGREMRKTLDVLRSRFDRVIIDAPPAMPMADVSILTPQVDGVLIICRAGVTETPALQQAVGALDPSRVLGVVLNDIHP